MFREPLFPFGKAMEEKNFVGRLLAPALKPFRVWHVNKKSENVAAHDFVDKSQCEERLLHLGIYFTHETVWLRAADSLTRAFGIPKAYLCNYYSTHWKTEHCKYVSRKTIAFWAMVTHIASSKMFLQSKETYGQTRGINSSQKQFTCFYKMFSVSNTFLGLTLWNW